jgi:hypothetical protein
MTGSLRRCLPLLAVGLAGLSGCTTYAGYPAYGYGYGGPAYAAVPYPYYGSGAVIGLGGGWGHDWHHGWGHHDWGGGAWHGGGWHGPGPGGGHVAPAAHPFFGHG